MGGWRALLEQYHDMLDDLQWQKIHVLAHLQHMQGCGCGCACVYVGGWMSGMLC